MHKLNYTIVFVADMKQSIGFYRDVLGLPLRFESPDWTEFATEGTTLALHTAVNAKPQEGNKPAGTCHPGFQVGDLDEFHRTMQARGVRCLQAPKSEEFGRLAVYADPDGLPISVAEMGKR
jgi:catechol 2,3-dioxygenase-like lactoylglutathione lyase family enzyme